MFLEQLEYFGRSRRIGRTLPEISGELQSDFFKDLQVTSRNRVTRQLESVEWTVNGLRNPAQPGLRAKQSTTHQPCPKRLDRMQQLSIVFCMRHKFVEHVLTSNRLPCLLRRPCSKRAPVRMRSDP